MKKILTCLTLTILSLGYSQDSISLLFIGNSYTYVNDLPTMTKDLATNLGKTITVDSKTNGGYTFQNHTTDPLTFNKIHSKSWDVVVIQGQSQEPSFPDSQVNTSTLPFAVQLADSVYANNACGNVMYFMTWGRKDGDSQWSEINTFEKMNNRLYNAYMRIADSSDKAMVSPVGSVWAYVRQNHPTIDLYSGDGSHPSLAGTYLSACVFYTALFRSSTVGASYTAGLDVTTAGILQQASDHVLDSLQKFRLHPIDEPTQAEFTISQQGNSTQFINASYHATNYLWDFGDGNTSTVENPTHTYATNGTYTVTLTATSTCNDDVYTLQHQVTTASIDELNEIKIQIKTTTDGTTISTSDINSSFAIYTVDGKLIEHSDATQSIFLAKKNQVFIVHITTKEGTRKIVRIFG